MVAGGVIEGAIFVVVVGGGGVVVATGFGVDFGGRDVVLVTAATGVEAMVAWVEAMFEVVAGVGEDVCVVVVICALRSAGIGDVADPTLAGSGAGVV